MNTVCHYYSHTEGMTIPPLPTLNGLEGALPDVEGPEEFPDGPLGSLPLLEEQCIHQIYYRLESYVRCIQISPWQIYFFLVFLEVAWCDPFENIFKWITPCNLFAKVMLKKSKSFALFDRIIPNITWIKS